MRVSHSRNMFMERIMHNQTMAGLILFRQACDDSEWAHFQQAIEKSFLDEGISIPTMVAVAQRLEEWDYQIPGKATHDRSH